MDRDVSAFAYTPQSIERVGLGTNGTGSGGWVYPVGLEVPIHRPQWCALTSSAFPPSQLQRYANLHATATGDATFLAAGQLTWFTENRWRMQRQPKLHQIDFNEFAEVVALWVQGIQQAFFDEPNQAATSPETIICPLTLLEMSLLLRNLLMTAFKDTQAGVHALYPVIPTADTDNQFVPFVVSSATAFLASIDFRLPMPIIENVRSLVHRLVHRGGNDWEVFIPVLGQYNGEVLNEADFNFVIPGVVPQVVPSFFPSSDILKKKVTSKSGLVYLPFAESPISLIDGSYSGGIACINDPTTLKNLAARWEAWLSGNIMNYSTNLGILGTEKGINILTSINMTRIYGLTPEDLGRQGYKFHDKEALAAKKQAQLDFVDVRTETAKLNRRLGSSPYVDQQISIDISQSKFLATAYEQLQSVWILPSVRVALNDLNQVTPVRWQSLMTEPYWAVRTNGEVGEIGFDLHRTYASKLVRARLAKDTDWEILFKTMESEGRGGILSSLVGKFANAIIPGAGDVVQAIGSAIGV